MRLKDYCAAKLDIVDSQKSAGAKIVSVAGFLSAAIKEDYQDGALGLNTEAKAETKASEIARQKNAAKEASARRQVVESREAEKRVLLERIKTARAWFDGHGEAEQARILAQFEATLDKPLLRADF